MTAVRARIGVATLGAAILWGLWLLADGTRPFLRAKAAVSIDILRGARTWDIAQQLQDIGAIRSRWTFLWLHALSPGNTLKAGEYSFNRPASTVQVLRKLIHGDVSCQVLTIPEGYNRFEIAGAVAAQGFSTREEFLRATEETSLLAEMDPQVRNLEGYLFPDSYQFPRHARPAQIVRTMVDRFSQVYFSLQPAAERPINEIVTMASLVEKETALPEERPLVAAVFYNRLERRMALQCDPTVVYAAILENRYDGKIRQSQLNSSSPYNTYLHPGLPPGPIANPGKASLRAALQPASTNYLYFVAGSNGGHIFSRTLAEHNLAVSLYRKTLEP